MQSKEAEVLRKAWATSTRWKGILRPYSATDVVKLRGTARVAHTLGKMGSERLWELMNTQPFINALGALTGNQAVQQVQAGLKAIYCSGWQVAGDANDALSMYPDQSIYPVTSVPNVVRRINNALTRADQIQCLNEKKDIHWFAPIVADAEAGFGGALNVFELCKALISAGAAGIHLEDQLASAKKCGHMGGKVLVPTCEYLTKLHALRLAADVVDVPTVLIARTDAYGASLITSDCDERDRPFVKGSERTVEGFFHVKNGLDAAISRALSYAPYADLLWYETDKPDLQQAKQFAESIRKDFPGKLMAYNCSPSFNWKLNLSQSDLEKFQKELGAMGFKFQFVTLAGFHALNFSMFKLADDYRTDGMAGYSRLQEEEFALESKGYTATRHQSFVGTGYFDEIAKVVSGNTASTIALKGSTEESQFAQKPQ